MEKRQPWNLGGLAMIEFLVLIILITGVFAWAIILFTIIKIWMEL
jgi:hypothetical protein